MEKKTMVKHVIDQIDNYLYDVVNTEKNTWLESFTEHCDDGEIFREIAPEMTNENIDDIMCIVERVSPIVDMLKTSLAEEKDNVRYVVIYTYNLGDVTHGEICRNNQAVKTFENAFGIALGYLASVCNEDCSDFDQKAKTLREEKYVYSDDGSVLIGIEKIYI